MYRLLAARHGGVRERRDQLAHPPYAAPELLAEQPNEVWSWDITKLKGPAKWTHYYLNRPGFRGGSAPWFSVALRGDPSAVSRF